MKFTLRDGEIQAAVGDQYCWYIFVLHKNPSRTKKTGDLIPIRLGWPVIRFSVDSPMHKIEMRGRILMTESCLVKNISDLIDCKLNEEFANQSFSKQ